MVASMIRHAVNSSFKNGKPPAGASEPRPRKLRVGRVPAEPKNETTEPPVHLCGDGGLECRGDQIGTRAPWSGIIAQISRGPGVRAILALVDHSTAALERHRRDASYGGRREVARDRPLSVRRTGVLTRPDSPHLDIWRDSPDNSSSSREASLNPSPLACSYHARAAATSGSNSVAPSFFNIMGS